MLASLGRTRAGCSCKGKSNDSAAQGLSASEGRAAAADDDKVLQRIRQQFSSRAPTYDATTAHNFHAPLAQRLLQLVRLQSGDRLLDLGAGTGIVALAAAAAVAPGGSVVLVDITQAMLDQARVKYEAFQKAGTPEATQPAQPAEPGQEMQQQQLVQAHFILGDMEQLADCLPAEWCGSFSAITCSAAVPFLRRPAEALTAWRGWLKQPGGRLAFNAFVPPALEDFGTFRRLKQEAGFPEEPDPCDVLGSVELVAAALEDAGYSHVEVASEGKERWMPATSPEAYAQGIWELALHRNPLRGPEELQAQPQRLQALEEAFVAAVVQDVVASGRWDAGQQRVLNKHTVLHVLARA